jgi:small conductance mechanosensitive channel
MNEWNLESMYSLMQSWGENLLAAAAVGIVGWIVMRLLVSALRRALARTKADDILTQFIALVAKVVLMGVVAVLMLERLGVQTTSLVAGLGALGLALGLALQDSLKNFAAGLLLIARRPFKAEDFVEAGGTSGIVEDINLITTTLRTPDNRSVIVPNNAIFQDIIINYSARARRRIDMEIGISYSDDVDRAQAVIREILAEETRVFADPEPVVQVHALGDSSVVLVVRPWVATDDYWSVRWDLTKKIKATFDSQGISFPFPQLDVHLEQVA